MSLTLNAVIFGNSVTFHESDILGISWTATLPTLVITDLTLASLDVPTLLLIDNGSNTGEADCSGGPCQNPTGGDANETTVHWTYTPQAAAVPEPATFALLIAACGLIGAVGGRYSSRT